MGLPVNFVVLPDTSEYFNMSEVVRIVPQADGTARFYYRGDEFFTKSYGTTMAQAVTGVNLLISPTAL